MNPRITCLAAVLLFAVTASAQSTPKPVTQTLTGCVARLPNTADKYVLATGDRCLLLTGTFNAIQIADHEIVAKGIVIEPSGMAPLTLNIQAVQSARSCTRTCVLEPPGTRGIHGKERPGKEGGTPGVTTTPGPQN